jgi:Lon protease-like protein
VGRSLGMFPLSTVLFPGAVLPLHVFESRYRRLMADCLADDHRFGVVLITRGSEVGGGDQRADTGTMARITRVAELEDGRMMVVAEGTHRLRVEQWLADDPYPRAIVDEMTGDDPDVGVGDSGGQAHPTPSAEAAVRLLCSLLSELGDVPALPHDLDLGGGDEAAAWQLCGLAPLNLIDRQRLLVCTDTGSRMALLGELCTAMSDDVVALLAGGLSGDGGD